MLTKNKKSKGFSSLVTCLLAASLLLISFAVIKYGIISKNIFREKQTLDACGIALGVNIIQTNDVANICTESFLNRCGDLLNSNNPLFKCEDLGIECIANESCKRKFEVRSTYDPGLGSVEKAIEIEINEEVHDVEKIDAAVIFLLDYSGSMSGNRISQLKLATRQFINSQYNLSYSVILYNNDIIKHTDISKGLDHNQTAVSFVNETPAGGGTNFVRPINKALTLINETQHEVYYIVLVSDGSPNEGLSGSLNIVNNRIRSISQNNCLYSNALNPCITIFTLGVDNANMSILNSLSGNALSQQSENFSFNIAANETREAFNGIIKEIMCRIGPVFANDDIYIFEGLDLLEQGEDYIYDSLNKIVKFYDVSPINACSRMIDNDSDITLRWGRPLIKVIN